MHGADEGGPRKRIALAQAAILLVLTALLYRNEIGVMVRWACLDQEWAHLLACPALIALLLYRRRRELAAAPAGGSPWGLALLALALLAFLGFTWPFNFAYPRFLSLVPAVAGVILVSGGWTALRLCVPILLILLVAIPIPVREHAYLVIWPETVTLRAAQVVLDLLPGVTVELRGPDLHYMGRPGTGTIALGEPYRGASLLATTLTIGIFVAFATFRPAAHLVLMALVAVPIVLLCNLARVIFWGLVTIFARCGPLDSAPRVVATLSTLLLAWGLFTVAAAASARIVVQAPAGEPGP